MQVEFGKYTDGLAPAVVQHCYDGRVMMVGFMNEEALAATRQSGRVTFYSRSKMRLWTKGETSGNYLQVKEILVDCDQDTLLIKAYPLGPTCHTGADTCFGENNILPAGFITYLETIITHRKQQPSENSYTSKLFAKGINKIAQKVGEEAIELVIESKDDHPELFLGEAADLLFHYLILLQAKGYTLQDVVAVLKQRHK